jgi:hypothetical protein
MGMSTHIHFYIELIAARDPARRMHDHCVANSLTFRIQRPLDTQRAIVQPMLQDSALAMPDEAKFEPRAPTRMRLGLRLRLHCSERGVIFVKRHANERAIDVLVQEEKPQGQGVRNRPETRRA